LKYSKGFTKRKRSEQHHIYNTVFTFCNYSRDFVNALTKSREIILIYTVYNKR